MNKNNNFKSNTFLIVILIIIAILLFINIFLYVKKNIYESFTDYESKESNYTSNLSNNISDINLGINFQSGISGINSTGTINFQKPFLKTPIIFTQIIGSSSTALNVYSVQIFGATTTGFNYSKNKAYNNTQQKSENSDVEYVIPKIEPSTTEPFIWVAFR
jgi:predicted PurR-regulated permease PerM